MTQGSRSSIWKTRDTQRDNLRAKYSYGTIPVEYVVVGGGGSGGAVDGNAADRGGGGGAGGFITNEGSTPLELLSGVTYTISIGSGGTASGTSTIPGTSGANTEFNSLLATPGQLVRAYGGGGGGGHNAPGVEVIGLGGTPAASYVDGNAPNIARGGLGGSGGGSGVGWHWGTAEGIAFGFTPAPGSPGGGDQGYNGGRGGSYGTGQGGGGGGGAGGVGRPWAGDPYYSAPGGFTPGVPEGSPYDFPGARTGGPGRVAFDGNTYAGGGGGGRPTPATPAPRGQGGAGGGGHGGRSGNNPADTGTAGTAGTGGGGGGSRADSTPVANGNPRAGGNGGTGVCIIRYPASFPIATYTTGSPTYTESGGYRYYKWTSSGTIVF